LGLKINIANNIPIRTGEITLTAIDIMLFWVRFCMLIQAFKR